MNERVKVGDAGVEADSPTVRTTAAPRRRSVLRPVLYLIVLIALGLVAWRFAAPSGPRGGRQQQAQDVGAAEIGTGDIREVITGLGTVTPLATITVQTQINGQLVSVGFREGQAVQKGDFLAQIDPRPYQAALDQAQGTLTHDQGLLDQAQSDLVRFEKLGKQDSIALQQVTDQEFLVKQDEGTVAADKAVVETDKLNLAYCRIIAPVTGRVGLRLVDPGNYVQTTNTTGLVVLTQLQPISVVFVVAEDDVQAIWAEVRAGQTLSVTAYNRSDDKPIATGVLESVDNEIDTTTGTIKLRATFPNTDEALFPNQFVNARLLVRTLTKVTEAPVAAIQRGAPGTFAYLIKPDGSVVIQVVKIGVTDGDRVQILSGLKPGDKVVVDGADRLRVGEKVRIVPDQGNPAANADAQPPADGAADGASSGSPGKSSRKQGSKASPSSDAPSSAH